MPAENKKRILIFSLAYHPFVGGAEVAIKEITERLGEDFEFDMITANLSGHEPKEIENFNGISRVYRLGAGKFDKYRFPWLAYNKALELQQKNDYDAVWAMMANQAGLAALKFKRRFPQIPYLLTLQEGDSELNIWLRTWFIRPIYKAIYRRADYIQAISNFLAKRAKRLGAKCPIEVVPNGGVIELNLVDLKDYSKQKNNAEFVAEFDSTIVKEIEQINKNLKKGDNLIITTSRLVKKNGIVYLIQAMKFLPNNFKLRIIGDGKLKLKLKKTVKKLNLKDRVEFIGQIDFRKLYKYYWYKPIIFVRPSLSEGLGNVFLEAMSMSIPVIGTKVGGIPDFLVDGETGWFCKVKNPESIAEKINYILSEKNKAEVERVVENAQKLVAEKYNWNKIAGEMKNIFNKLANGQE
ncbi:MAG: glycosyltransferase family 4 protein [Candidatus Buchananbacteria bacterium]